MPLWCVRVCVCVCVCVFTRARVDNGSEGVRVKMKIGDPTIRNEILIDKYLISGLQ